MKVYGFRHIQEPDCVILCSRKQGSENMLRVWLNSCTIEWKDRFNHFEEIEADLEYEVS